MIKSKLSTQKAMLFLIAVSVMIFWSSVGVFSQSVEVTEKGSRWDGKEVYLHTTFGKRSKRKKVRLWNKTRNDLKIRVNEHSSLKFILFREKNSKKRKKKLTLKLSPGEKTYIKVYAYIKSGKTGIYNTILDLHLSQNGKTATIKIPLTAYIHTHKKKPTSRTPSKNPVFQRPKGYQFWPHSQNGGMVRIKLSELPLKVYSNHSKFNPPGGFDTVIKRSLYTWNVVAESIGLTKRFFVTTNKSSEADILVDWSGNGLRRNALGVARMMFYTSRSSRSVSRYVVLNGIIMKTPTSGNLGRITETLMQELGHLLGLGHSEGEEGRKDIMSPMAHSHFHGNLSEVNMTDRDRQMLGWLYTRKKYIPAISKRSKRPSP